MTRIELPRDVVQVENLSRKEFWDSEWTHEERKREEHHIDNYLFNPVLKRFLPKGGTCLEVGCAPGTTLVNFVRNFGYRVTGIDYSSASIIRERLRNHGVEDYELYEADFTQFTTDKKFDVVASFGLIEHFVDYESIILKHAEFVAPGGHLVISVPNIRYFNWLLYKVFNPSLISIHNLKVMDKFELSRPVRSLGDFKVVYCNYFKSCFCFLTQKIRN